MKILLVTLAIGDQYITLYNKLFRKSHEQYAKRNCYDFMVITDYISQNTTYPVKHPHLISFQKILVCSQIYSNNYDYIIFIDADILINTNAPPLHNTINWEDKIGIVDEFSQPTPQQRIQIQHNNCWEDSATEYYKLAGFDINTINVLNTGVLVMQPRKHGQFLLQIYNKYAETAIGHPRGFGYEQSCIGYELQMNNKWICLNNKWNSLWALYKSSKTLQTVYQDSYFIHFAGKCDFYLIPHLIL